MNYKKLDRNLPIHKIEINLGIFIKHLMEYDTQAVGFTMQNKVFMTMVENTLVQKRKKGEKT